MTERQKAKNPEFAQGILFSWGVVLAKELFENLAEIPEYQEADKIADSSNQFRRVVVFFLGEVRYALTYNPEGIKALESIPQKIILKKRRQDGLIEERLTIAFNETTIEGAKNKILYERFDIRRKSPRRVEKNNAVAIAHARRIISMRGITDLSV